METKHFEIRVVIEVEFREFADFLESALGYLSVYPWKDKHPFPLDREGPFIVSKLAEEVWKGEKFFLKDDVYDDSVVVGELSLDRFKERFQFGKSLYDQWRATGDAYYSLRSFEYIFLNY